MKMCTVRYSFSILAILVGLSACSKDSAVSKTFRGKPPETLAPDGGYGPRIEDRRPLIAQVTSVTVENTPGGAIVRATGLAEGQGYWGADLVRSQAESTPSSDMRLEFRVRPPQTAVPGGAETTREVIVAAFASNFDLQGIRSITVVGAQNERVARR